MKYVNINSRLFPEWEPVLQAANRGFRYGDGLFETMKFFQGTILLDTLHFDRLFSGLSMLQFEVPKPFTRERIKNEITKLCEKNNCSELARVRLSIFRGNGGLNDEDDSLQYLIESMDLPDSCNDLNENGLIIDLYKDIRKAPGVFSNIKSANFLPYTMASIFSRKNRLNDSLVMNTYGNVADATIANVFVIKGETICTPALAEGCIDGVMRRYLLENLKNGGYSVLEATISETDILDANELFLTNTIYGIRWVKQCREKIYSREITTEIYSRFLKKGLWQC